MLYEKMSRVELEVNNSRDELERLNVALSELRCKASSLESNNSTLNETIVRMQSQTMILTV